MTMGSILLATALLLLVGVFVFRPIIAPTRRTIIPMTERSRIEAEKEALLTQIRALDFDYETGKLPEEQYQRERLVLMQAAADRLRQMDSLPETESVDARIEAAVAALRGKSLAVKVTSAESSLVCHHCSEPIAENDKFCRSCGEKLNAEA